MIKFKIQHTKKYITIPLAQFRDSRLSLGAIGLYSWLVSEDRSWDGTLSGILNKCNTTEQELSIHMNELISSGYIEKDKDGAFKVLDTPKKKSSDTTTVNVKDITNTKDNDYKEEKNQRLNLFQKCELAVDEYTKDEELHKVLMDYLVLRLNPIKGSRLDGMRIAHINQWKGQLNTLNSMVGNKVKIVQQSINNSWAKFVDIPTSSDSAVSSTYTKEEMEEIKRLVADIESKGGKASF